MKFIATNVDDSYRVLGERISAQQERSGFALDSYFYRSHLTYQRELERIIYKSWLYAGHISQIPNPGDYFLFDLGEDSIIINRDASGEVHAMHNICRHRGARVCEDLRGNRTSFVCPYHGWVYNDDGSLKVARDMNLLEGFNDADFGLKPVNYKVFEGLIFINCDIEAPDWSSELEKLSKPIQGYDLANAKIAESTLYKVDANWKLCLENYLECYHCATSHRAYAKSHSLKALACQAQPLNDAMMARAEEATAVEGITDEIVEYYSLAKQFGGCVCHSRYALYDGYVTGSEDGKPVAPLMGGFKGYDGGASDFHLGPLTFMLNYPDHCVLYRFIPRSLTQTDMQLVWFVRGDAEEGVDYSKKRVSWLWDHTTQEDEFIITRNSEGVNSHFFEPGPFHPEFEELSMMFVDWYLKALGPVSDKD